MPQAVTVGTNYHPWQQQQVQKLDDPSKHCSITRKLPFPSLPVWERHTGRVASVKSQYISSHFYKTGIYLKVHEKKKSKVVAPNIQKYDSRE